MTTGIRKKYSKEFKLDAVSWETVIHGTKQPNSVINYHRQIFAL